MQNPGSDSESSAAFLPRSPVGSQGGCEGEDSGPEAELDFINLGGGAIVVAEHGGSSGPAACPGGAVARPNRKRPMPHVPGPAHRTADHHACVVRAMNDGRKVRALQRKLEQAAGSDDEQAKHSRGPAEQLAIAFSRSACITSIAKQHRVSRSYVRNVVCSVAYAVLQLTIRVLQSVLNMVEVKAPSLVVDVLKFDETLQKLSLDCHDGMARDQRSTPWPILVQRRCLVVVVDGRRWELALPMPPTILVGSKSAGAHWQGLFCQKFSSRVERLIQQIRSFSPMSLCIRETDSAAVCMKLNTFEARRLPAQVLCSAMYCGLRQANLVTTSVFRNVPGASSLIASMSAHAALMRGGNFWLRTVLAIQHLFDSADAPVRIFHRRPRRRPRTRIAPCSARTS